jgi:hypothetical protein
MSRISPFARWVQPVKLRISEGYLAPAADGTGDLVPTASLAGATHTHGIDPATGDIVVVPIGTDTGGVRTRVTRSDDGDTVTITGA